MKKLILISALLFSFNGWAEVIYLKCERYHLSYWNHDENPFSLFSSLEIDTSTMTLVWENKGMTLVWENKGPYNYSELRNIVSFNSQSNPFPEKDTYYQNYAELDKLTGNLITESYVHDKITGKETMGGIPEIKQYFICRKLEPLF